MMTLGGDPVFAANCSGGSAVGRQAWLMSWRRVSTFVAVAVCATSVVAAKQEVGAQSPAGACDLVTAAAVSVAVGETVTVITTARSPKSLCAFQKIPTDMHVTTEAFQPHSRAVAVTLFDAATMSDPKVGSTIARVGCRTTLDACQKALKDRSPQELYLAQPHGSVGCSVMPNCFVSADGIAWGMNGGKVVAISVIAGGNSAPNPAMELTILKSAAAKL